MLLAQGEGLSGIHKPGCGVCIPWASPILSGCSARISLPRRAGVSHMEFLEWYPQLGAVSPAPFDVRPWNRTENRAESKRERPLLRSTSSCSQQRCPHAFFSICDCPAPQGRWRGERAGWGQAVGIYPTRLRGKSRSATLPCGEGCNAANQQIPDHLIIPNCPSSRRLSSKSCASAFA